MNMFVLIRLRSYTTVYYSKALEEYEQVQSNLNLWTCYLLSLIAPPDAIKIDLNQDPTDSEYQVVRYDGEEITVRMPSFDTEFLSSMEMRDQLYKYVVRTLVILEVCLDVEFITNLFKELNQELDDYSRAGGGTIYRMCLEDKREVALAIEPLLQKKEWAKQWASFQNRYTKIIAGRVFRGICSEGVTYKIWDTCNDFHFEMSDTFAEHEKWFPNAIVKTPKEPQFV